MCNRHNVLLLLVSIFLLAHFDQCHADIGTAASYKPPYLPTACYGNDPNQFPAGNLFAAAGDGIWDNGASCGRQYLVKCLSSATPNACVQGQTIQLTIVDRASGVVSPPSQQGTTMVLSEAAFGMISAPSAKEINIEFRQV